MRKLLALVLIALLAVGPGLAAASAKAAPDCPMVGMSQAAHGDALGAICKIQCQYPAAIPMPETRLPAQTAARMHVSPSIPLWGTRLIAPEAPPPRG